MVERNYEYYEEENLLVKMRRILEESIKSKGRNKENKLKNRGASKQQWIEKVKGLLPRNQELIEKIKTLKNAKKPIPDAFPENSGDMSSMPTNHRSQK